MQNKDNDNIATDLEVAAQIMKESSFQLNALLRWFAEFDPSFSAQVFQVLNGGSGGTATILSQMPLLTESHRLPLTKKEMLIILGAMNGHILAPCPYTYLPEYLAMCVYDEMMQDQGNEPIAREIEDTDTDAEYWAMFQLTPMGQLHAKLKNATPAQAFALIVGAIFWWGYRSYIPEWMNASIPANPKPFQFDRYFQLCDSEE